MQKRKKEAKEARESEQSIKNKERVHENNQEGE